MERLSAWEMYQQLTAKDFIVSVMVNEEDGATEITSTVERCGKYSLTHYSVDRAEVNPYTVSCISLYVDEIEDDYSSNMPCDNTGFCAGTSCSQYFKCRA